MLGARGSPLPWLARRLPPRLARDRIVKAAAEPRARRYATIPNIFDALLRARIFHAGVRRRRARAHRRSRRGRSTTSAIRPTYLDHLLDIDARLWLPDDLLAKVDRATMAFSLEARVPYLDHDFYGWCARLDPSLKVRGDARKLPAEALAAALPAARHRPPRKAGLHDAARALARARAEGRHRAGAGPARARAARADPPRGDRAAAWRSMRRAARTTRCGCGCC